MSLRQRLAHAGELLGEFYTGPYRRTLARARRDEDDLVRVLVLGQALGVPDPAQFYTLELVPLMYEELGDWQERLAQPTSPFDHTRCCC
ncbi:hypothetical protein BJY21_000828 [Kineosphaera limosa]|uniref:Uncharacterized protein n=1 Tax=Kineosphaera limosa NBRC 100340 TaxID=1184609 RepID=K6VHB6_9MICO|nr:cory-CC-star protein [Kineosphaera limosa]NYD99643.1 hypothetical protein [Kineosphaera limosa]GAB95598.1 hypothetical protein KILIM_024_00080 [Kineosphaera limosa NBRC 100340]